MNIVRRIVSLFVIACFFCAAIWPLSTSAQTVRRTPSGKIYANEEFGFSIACPDGWFLHDHPLIRGSLVLFNQSRSPSYALPGVNISVDVVKPRAESLRNFADKVVAEYTNQKHTVVEPITEITIPRASGYFFTIEMIPGGQRQGLRMSQYIFGKGDLAISVMYGATLQDFEFYLADARKAIESFSFLEPEDDYMRLSQLGQVPVAVSPPEPAAYETFRKKLLDAMNAARSFKSMLLAKNLADEQLAKTGYMSIKWSMVFNSPQDFEVNQSDFKMNAGDLWRVVGDDIYSFIAFWMPMPKEAEAPQLKDMIAARRQGYRVFSWDAYRTMFETEQPAGIAHDKEQKFTIVKFEPKTVRELFTGNPRDGSFRSEVFVWVLDKDMTVRFVKTVLTGRDKDQKEIREEYEHFFSSYNAPFLLGVPDMSWKESAHSDARTGLTMTGPALWKKEDLGGRARVVSWFQKDMRDIPYMTLRVVSLPPEVKTLEDYKTSIGSFYAKDAKIKMLQDPAVVTFNNTSWVKIVSESQIPDRAGTMFTLRTDTYLCVRGAEGLQIFVSDNKDHFAQIEKEIEAALSTMRFEEGEAVPSAKQAKPSPAS